MLDDPIRLTFEFSLLDAARAVKVMRPRRRMRNVAIMLGFVGVLFVVNVTVTTIRSAGISANPGLVYPNPNGMPLSPPAPTRIDTLSAIVPWMFVFLAIWVALIMAMRRSTAWQRRLASQPWTYVFAPLGVSVNQLHVREELEWRFFTDWTEAKEFFVLRPAEADPRPIPKRAFRDNAEMDRFRAMLQSAIGMGGARQAFPMVSPQALSGKPTAIPPPLPTERTGEPAPAGAFAPLVITCNYTLDEVRQGLEYITRSQSAKSSWRGYVILAGFILGIDALWSAFLPDEFRKMLASGGMMVFAFPFVFAGTWALIICFGLLGQRSRFQRAARRADILALEHVFVLRASGLLLTLPQSRHEYAWGQFTRYEETDRFFFLWPSRTTAYIFPKRVFTEPGQLQQFAAILHDRVNRPAVVGNVSSLPAQPVV